MRGILGLLRDLVDRGRICGLNHGGIVGIFDLGSDGFGGEIWAGLQDDLLGG
ncbi:MAG: hypothetical protein AABZ44_10515 [Elusimicrobiota bacterium]